MKATDHPNGGSQQDASVGLIVRQQEPRNLETPLGRLDSFLTPAHLFYIRSHFHAPTLDAATYRLTIGGAVSHPLSISLEELHRMPSETRPATLECAGNSRVFLVPQVKGAQWEAGAVGNAEWTGVPLALLLERAGLAEDACEIVLEGADRGTPVEPPVPPDPISYARSLQRSKAMGPEVLIAYRMNGRDLPHDHGYPVRAIVPGHYGMASVKWLTGIHAVREPFRGYWQTSDYAAWEEVDGRPVRVALADMQIKSVIIRPGVGEMIPPNTRYTVAGMAWTGESEVTEVAVSTDGGATSSVAEFVDPPRRYAWRRWRFDWQTPDRPGSHILMARARDASGNVQPGQHDPNHGSYVINHPVPIAVVVGDPAS